MGHAGTNMVVMFVTNGRCRYLLLSKITAAADTKSCRSVRSAHVSVLLFSANQLISVGTAVSPELFHSEALLKNGHTHSFASPSHREESMGEMSLDWGFPGAGGAGMDEEDEVLASNEGSEEVTHVLSAL